MEKGLILNTSYNDFILGTHVSDYFDKRHEDGVASLGFVPVAGPGLALTYLLVDTVYEEITDKSIAEQIEDSLK